MRAIGKHKEGPVGSNMDSHDPIAHSTYCSPCGLFWDRRTLSLLLSLFALQSSLGQVTGLCINIVCEHNTHHINTWWLRQRQCLKCQNTNPSLTQLIAWKDFMVLVLTLKDTENTQISQNKIRNSAWTVIYNCHNIVALIVLHHRNWEGE